MNQLVKFSMLVYSLVVIGGGVYRPLMGEEGGENGLYFGLVMGAIGLVATGLLFSGKLVVGKCTALLSVLFVAGWFGYEIFIKKGIAVAASDIRMMIVFITAVTAGCILTGSFLMKTPDQSQQ